MKVKIKIIENGKEKTIEKKISEKDHLQSQIKYKHLVFRNKKKYTRKIKHKGKEDV